MFLRAITVACVLGWAAEVRAAPQVLVQDAAPGQPGLCDALRIQIGRDGVLCRGGGSPGASLDVRIAALAREVRAQGARLGVLLVHGDNPGVAQMVVVSDREEEAVLMLEPRRGGSSHDVDRSLALKLVDTLDAVTRADAERAARAGSDTGAKSDQELVTVALAPGRVPGPARHRALLIEGGYGLRLDPGARGVVSVATGFRTRSGPHALEVVVSAALPSAVRRERAAGAVELRRFDYALALRSLWQWSRYELGAQLAGGISDFRASAVSALGERGRGQAVRGEVAIAALARVRLFATAYLGVAPSLAYAPAVQDFVVDGSAVLRLARTCFDLPLVLGIRTP